MVRLFYATMVGLVGAAMLHLLIIFLLPSLSSNKSWNFIDQNAEIFQPVEIFDASFSTGQSFLFDPLFRHFVCRYDLKNGALKVTASSNNIFWSLAVLNNDGTVFFSANDRIANTAGIDLAVVNNRQLRFVRQNTPDELSNSLIASAATDQGYVIIRVFIPDSSWESAAENTLSTMECTLLEF